MRSRVNRKKGDAGIRFPAPLAAVLMLAAAILIAYLWLCQAGEAVGARIKLLEKEKAELHKKIINEEFKWSNMKSPKNIEQLLAQHKLEMAWPQESQIVRLRYTRRELAAPAGGRGVFAQQTGGATAHD